MERDSVVQESGRSVFKCRGDVAPRGRAFWVRMRLSEDLTTAFILFQSGRIGGPPGIATVELQTGRLLDVLQ